MSASERKDELMVKAIWNNHVIAESDETVVVEGNHYFPPQCVKAEHLRASSLTTVCGWKGTAHYYDLVVDGRTNPGAAWHYPTPKEAAKQIEGRIAFWKGVQVVGE
jgi:uncharacterized protein (DUF427 family)